MQITNNLKLHTIDALARADRYLAIVAWAMKRYTREGSLAIYAGNYPTAYSRVEALAWHRYMA